MGATGIEPMTSTVSRLTLVVNLIDSLCVFLLHLVCCYVIFGAYWTQNGLTFYLFSPLSSRVFSDATYCGAGHSEHCSKMGSICISHA